MCSRFGSATISHRSSLRLTSVLALLLISVAACAGDDLLLPGDGEPARIVPLTSNVTATVGQTLDDSLVVEVTDPGGRPVSGVEVRFVPRSGGTVSPAAPVTTDSRGRAAVQYTLGTVAGSQTVEAHAPIVPETNAVAVFAITANPEPAEELVLDAGTPQSGQVSTALPVPLSVKAVDRFNNGVAGIEVTWEAEGGAEVNPETAVTGADGKAATTVTLGDRPGSYTATATAEDLEGSPVSFSYTALAAPRPALVIVTQPSSTAAAGVPLAQQPELQLQDAAGAPLSQADVRVTVQIEDGDGSLGGRTSAESDASGRVRFTDLELRGETGTRTLIFAADDFTPVISDPIVVQPGPPSDDESSVSVGNGTAGVTTPVSAVLRDEFGNRIAGAGGDLSIRIEGANPSSGLIVTDNGNGSYSASYVPLHAGTDQVILEYRGAPLGSGSSVVFPGPTDPRASTAEVTRSGTFFVRVDVALTVRDAQGNVVGHGGDQVQISANGSAPRSCAPPDDDPQTCVDNGDGTYTDSFFIIANDVTVNITVNGVPIAGSPFQLPAD
jgi:hypothetical protein